eukprot:g1831.t1
MPNGLDSEITFSQVREFYGAVWNLGDAYIQYEVLATIRSRFGWSFDGDVLGISSWLILLFCPAFLESDNAEVFTEGLTVIEDFNAQNKLILKQILKSFSEEDMKDFLIILRTNLTSKLEDSDGDAFECFLALELISCLYDANQVTHVVSHTEFYIPAFNNLLYSSCSQHETLFQFCVQNYPFIFSAVAKSLIVGKEFNKLRDDYRQRYFDQHDEYPGKLYLNVHRNNLLEDGIDSIMKARKNGNLHSSTYVTFVGEEGVDHGGLSREFFRVISEHLFRSEYGMFIYDDDSNFWWLLSSDLLDLKEEFIFTGILIGLALFNGYLLNLQLPLVFYKKLLGQELNAEDLKDVHPDIHRSLKHILDMDSGVEDLGLFFSVEDNTGLGSRQEVDLKANGSEIAVTEQNKHEYVQLYTHYLLEEQVKSVFDPLKSGFLEVCQSVNLNSLQPIELEEILCGLKETDVADLKSHTSYTSCESTSSIVVWFWEIFSNYSENEKRKLLAFVTGSDRAPVSGFGALNPKFTIRKVDNNFQSLPTSATCYNRLSLPDYETKHVLKERLDTALKYSEGFGTA